MKQLLLWLQIAHISQNQPGLIKFNAEGKSYIRIQNSALFDIIISRNEKLGFLENCPNTSKIE